MRIAVISDIHANIIALKAVIKHIQEQKIDKIIFLGDLVMNGPNPKETLETVKELSPMVWIKGNTDNWLYELSNGFTPRSEGEERTYSLYQYVNKHLTSQDIELLLSKPDKQNIEVEGFSILCVHGSHRSNSEPIGVMCTIESLERTTNEISEDVLLCGHTHLPYFSSFNGKKIINPGSVSLSMDGEAVASYGILDVHDRAVTFTNYKVAYDIEQVLKEAEIREFPHLDTYIEKLTIGR